MSREVLMLGTARGTRGGVSSVVKAYENGGLFSAWPITYLSTHCDGGFSRKMVIAIRAWFSFAGWVLRRRDFVLHVHCASRASFWRKCMFMIPAIWTGRPLIFHLHGGGFMKFYRQECGSAAKRVVRYVLDRCARIVVLSESWREDIATITKNQKIDVIHNPVVPSSRHSESQTDEPTLAFLGRLGRPKGTYDLIDALAIVVTKHPGAKLVCGGDGAVDDVYRKAGEAGVGKNLDILGWIDESSRDRLLSKASVYVLPSYAEGLPMSILEAMSAGLPIISTPVGGIPEAVANGVEGILVNPGDVPALADAICRLLGDKTLRENMGANARAKFEKHFHVNAVLPQVGAMYRELGVAPREPA